MSDNQTEPVSRRAILEFDLPEADYSFKNAVHADEMASAIWDFKQFMRTRIKHCSDDTTEKELEIMEMFRDEFCELFNGFGEE
jgi:hypothetical protein